MDSSFFEPVIGLEIHAELNTASKAFCGCSASHTNSVGPNSFICPVCTGQPGALPVLNKKAMEMALLVGLALNCSINEFNSFSRKNYFYPDLPKGYQISQFEHPVASNGWQTILREIPDKQKRVRIRRVHLEEDTAKILHEKDHALLDFNRAGVPLLEIVTEPDMHSPEEVLSLAHNIRNILRYLGVNSGDMEKGILRFEANISIRPLGSSSLFSRTEIKNLNSFRALFLATTYEIDRQIKLVNSQKDINQETLGWDEIKEVTYSQRGKEEAHDYRYYPEPDLPIVLVDQPWIEKISRSLPELPETKIDRFIKDYGLTYHEASNLSTEMEYADFFEKVVLNCKVPVRIIYNWIVGDFFKYMNEAKIELKSIPIKPENFSKLLELNYSQVISDYSTKVVLADMFSSNKEPEEIISDGELHQISDEKHLEEIVLRILADNPKIVLQYKEGKQVLLQWFMGQISRETGGKSNPKIVRELLIKNLN